MNLGGMHHVTAVTGDATRNLDFYTRTLGLRLVKKTVNQDVISTYHLFYADEVGTPGTDMTFFEWPDVGRHIAGVGDVSATSFIVPGRDALDWWAQRLEEHGVEHGAIERRGNREVLPFTDHEGQRLELVTGEREGTQPWSESPVPQEFAIRGLGPPTLVLESFRPTVQVLTDILGFTQSGEYAFPDNPSRRALVFQMGPGGVDAEVHIEERPQMPPARVGIGGVHHIAFRTPDAEQHAAWQRRLAQAGLAVTPVIDRFYFKSIYFREPGGVLFEIATDGPGFASDEDVEHLGEKLSLPPFLESHRREIERHLHPLEPAVRT